MNEETRERITVTTTTWGIRMNTFSLLFVGFLIGFAVGVLF